MYVTSVWRLNTTLSFVTTGCFYMNIILSIKGLLPKWCIYGMFWLQRLNRIFDNLEIPTAKLSSGNSNKLQQKAPTKMSFSLWVLAYLSQTTKMQCFCFVHLPYTHSLSVCVHLQLHGSTNTMKSLNKEPIATEPIMVREHTAPN